MTFISAIDISKKYSPRGGKDRVSSSADVTLATHKSINANTKEHIYSLRFSISNDLIKKARYIAGDTVDVLFDFDSSPKRILITRSMNGGWKIFPSSKGKNSRFNFKITHRDEMPSFNSSVECDAVLTSEGILFDIPPTAIFGRNARA